MNIEEEAYFQKGTSIIHSSLITNAISNLFNIGNKFTTADLETVV